MVAQGARAPSTHKVNTPMKVKQTNEEFTCRECVHARPILHGNKNWCGEPMEANCEFIEPYITGLNDIRRGCTHFQRMI